MGLPRPSRKPVVLSDDEEDEDIDLTTLTEPELHDESAAAPKTRSRGSKATANPAAASKATKKSPRTKRKQEPQKSPAKAQTSKGKEDVKSPTTKPIYSFFNAATQRQTSLSQPLLSQENSKSQTTNEADTIHDESGSEHDSDAIELSTGSNTALALRKRKGQLDQAADATSGNGLGAARQKFRRANDGSRTPTLTVQNQDKRPWTDQFAPLDLSELAVHARKVRDVRQWLETCFEGKRHKVLVLKGTAGTGKTTTVRLLAKDMGFDVIEWKNPAGVDLVADGTASASAQFDEFVGRAGRAGSLTFAEDSKDAVTRAAPSSRKQVLLVEEFPSTFSRTSNPLQSFRSGLLHYVSLAAVPSGPPTPIVLVISETLLSTNTSAADSFTAHRLLGPDLSINPYVNIIEFNAIAPTILTKALELVILKEARKSGRRKGPGPQVIKHLVDTGDVRSAISSLEFLCLRGDDDLWSTKIAFTKTKRTKNETPLTEKEEEVLRLVSNRESTLGIFHAVGRVLYNNRAAPADASSVPQPPGWLQQHSRIKVPEKDINPLIDSLGTDTTTFVAALHENYLPSCGGATSEDILANISSCIDELSAADLLSVDRFSYEHRVFTGSATDSIRQDEMSFQLAARGMLFHLPHPVHRAALTEGRRGDAFRMYYPSSLRIWRQREEVESTLEHLTSRMANGTLQNPLSDGAKTASSSLSGGVASWKRVRVNQSETPTAGDGSDAGNLLMGLSSSEVVLERLPFLAHILASRASGHQASLLEKVRSVTRVQGQAGLQADEDAEGEERETSHATEQWSTDNPEAEGGLKKKPTEGLLKRRPKAETEGGGLAIPVEHRVEHLVLQDDDISD